MANFNHRQFGLITLLLALIFFFGFIFTKNNSAKNSPHSTSTTHSEAQVKTEENTTFTNQLPEEANSFPSIPKDSLESKEEKEENFDCTKIDIFFDNIANKYDEEFAEFFVKRGYWMEMEFISSEDIINYGSADYSTYSEDALRQLADQGDGKASMMLALTLQQQMTKEPDKNLDIVKQQRDQVIKFAYNATVEGYSAGILIIMVTYMNQASLVDQKENDDSLQALTWQYLGRQRNDPLSILFGNFMNLRNEFSEEDKKKAQKEANKIYEKLEQKREEKGLPPFDNSYPDFLEPAYRCIKPELES